VGNAGGQVTDALHPVGPDRFRAVMGRFATGVAVITATAAAEGGGHGAPVGMTANAVCSLSLDPLLLLVCFDRRARTLAVVRETERFGVNVLAAGQEDVARLFAGKGPEHEKFAEVPHAVHDGIPVIEGVLAWVGCRLERLVPGGDHTIGIGAVQAAELGDEQGGDPLIWFRGGYRA
jgi:flavin reductase (DIM6/NTAB) family NADH-FMN oxidoreductase RutF